MNWQLMLANMLNSTYHYVYNILAYKDRVLKYSKTTNLPIIVDEIDIRYEEFELYPEYSRFHYYFSTETDLSYDKFVKMFGEVTHIGSYEGTLAIVNHDGYVGIKLI